MARRVAIASMTVLTASGIGLVAAPMAFGQIVIGIGGNSQSAGVTNAGSASANSGGNTAIGNASSNTATADVPVGGLLNVPVTLGAPTNTSSGDANITTGPATAVGNTSETVSGQSNASGNTVNNFLAGQRQSAGVTNAGSGSANSGGNSAIGNGSVNNATVNAGEGGLLGVGVNLGTGPTNNSTGSATINSGAANATGNASATSVGQRSTQGGGGPGGGAILVGGGPGGGPGGAVLAGGGPGGARPLVGGGGIGGNCSSGRFGSVQQVDVRNRGEAQANTGNNVAIGNASTNDAAVNVPGQTVSGGLLGVGVTIGGPVNNSTGTAVINTGPATAVGNDAVNSVSQVEGCPQVTSLTPGRPGGPVVVPASRVIGVQQQVVRPTTATLARTGLDTGDLGMLAGAAVGLGILLIVSQRRRYLARHATVPMAGMGFGLGATDWDKAVR